MLIFCCECQVNTEAVMIKGSKVYPRSPKLHDLNFWQCPKCQNCVGCHRHEKRLTEPLGYIAGPELRYIRSQIHDRMEHILSSQNITKGELYAYLSTVFGMKPYHTAHLATIEQALKVRDYLKDKEF